jgi:hypothetical protein
VLLDHRPPADHVLLQEDDGFVDGIVETNPHGLALGVVLAEVVNSVA